MRLRSALTFTIAFILVPAAALAAARISTIQTASNAASAKSAQGRNLYTVTNLVSDGSIPAEHTDANLVNGWGIARSATGPWWVADNGTAMSTIYNGEGVPSSLVVSLPAAPTGIVVNSGTGFTITDGTNSAAAVFIFANEIGSLSAWNPTVGGAPPSTHAVTATTGLATDAIYKGLAIATTPTGDRLYAADFHNAKIDVFDSAFQTLVVSGTFVDPQLPAGFAPFGIQMINDRIYVSYAKQDEDREDEVAGPGLGYVSVFDLDGNFIARIASEGRLNAPWGMALAPDGFGKFGGDLLVGNFGDGQIVAYRIQELGNGNVKYRAEGVLMDENRNPIEIDGLWGIGFGNDGNAGPATTLFFAAGPAGETHGLFGKIEAQ